MRIQVGSISGSPGPAPRSQGWTPVTNPSSCAVHVFALVLGIAMLIVLLSLIIVMSLIGPPAYSNAQVDEPTPWTAIVLTLVLSVPAHEFVHALFHPGGGLSPATVLIIWPRKLQFGMYFDGHMSRRRWLLMRLAPLAVLAIAPAVLLIATASMARSFALETSLALLLLINAVGSGGDILAALWVLSQIPRGARLAFVGGKAYWLASEDR